MNETFLYLFAMSCGGLLLWGLREPSRVYQYPFLMGAIFTSFLLPQAIALFNNPGGIPQSAINQALFMGALCMLMAWAGYQVRPMRRLRFGQIHSLRIERFYSVGLVTGLVSLLSVYFMLQIPQEEIATGTGPFTILAFFSGLAAISFPIFLTIALWKPKLGNVLLAFVAGYPLYSAAFLAGRRVSTASFFVILILVLYFRKRYVLPRSMALLGVVLVMFLIPVFAEMRQEFWFSLLKGEFSTVDWAGALDKVLLGDVLELRNAAAIIFSTSFTGDYGLGTGYWDALVFRYVPGQLVGYDIKESLQFNWTQNVWLSIGYIPSSGSTVTGLGDTFMQFGYLGSLFYFLQGYLFKNIWWLAVNRQSPIAQLLYIGLIPVALVSVSHGSFWFVQGSLVIVLVIIATYRYARIKAARHGMHMYNGRGVFENIRYSPEPMSRISGSSRISKPLNRPGRKQ